LKSARKARARISPVINLRVKKKKKQKKKKAATSTGRGTCKETNDNGKSKPSRGTPVDGHGQEPKEVSDSWGGKFGTRLFPAGGVGKGGEGRGVKRQSRPGRRRGPSSVAGYVGDKERKEKRKAVRTG